MRIERHQRIGLKTRDVGVRVLGGLTAVGVACKARRANHYLGMVLSSFESRSYGGSLYDYHSWEVFPQRGV